ncbi:MAG: hypothetical protein E7611_02840 [Ruminococcaceae bacterium]|nr:hypothetical protein [Oscillospiraceae bacterium]
MKTYNFRNAPLRVFGSPLFYKTGKLERMPEEVASVIHAPELAKRNPGARVCFRTNAPSFNVKMVLGSNRVDIGMAIFGAQSAAVIIGDRQNPYYAGLVGPSSYEELVIERQIYKKGANGDMEDVTIFLPRNEPVLDVEISVDDAYVVEEPTPYRDIKPIVYYGSSITEGGCCTIPINAYNAIISNRLNIDYYNLGFSSSARGEDEVCDYIKDNFDMSIFVYDYDHNAPTNQHLEDTHERFFLRFREKHPDVPVIMMSRPWATYAPDDARRATIRKTYERAVERGDKNVYFIDGETFFKPEEAYLCLVDTVHPNDFGFHCMADRIQPVIEKILGL